VYWHALKIRTGGTGTNEISLSNYTNRRSGCASHEKHMKQTCALAGSQSICSEFTLALLLSATTDDRYDHTRRVSESHTPILREVLCFRNLPFLCKFLYANCIRMSRPGSRGPLHTAPLCNVDSTNTIVRCADEARSRVQVGLPEFTRLLQLHQPPYCGKGLPTANALASQRSGWLSAGRHTGQRRSPIHPSLPLRRQKKIAVRGF